MSSQWKIAEMGREEIFRTTRWSVVTKAAERGPDARAALAQLCETYWEPVYVFLRRSGNSPDDAADLTQGFMARLLEKGGLGNAQRERGRFRAFLLGAVRHFALNEHERGQTQKRGGGAVHVSLDFSAAEQGYAKASITPTTPEDLFQRRWALGILEAARESLRERYHREGKGPLFELLELHLCDDPAAVSYQLIAEQLGMSEPAIKVAAHRLRNRYGALIRTIIADTVESPDDIDSELQFLISTLGS